MNKIKKLSIVSALVLALVIGVGASSVFAQNSDKNSDKSNKPIQKILNSIDKRVDKPSMTGVDVRFGANGRVMVSGAKVTGISGNTISASTTWGSAVFNWTVNTDANTKFNSRHEGKTSLADIAVGHTVSFSGTINGSSPLNVNAGNVKDWSLEKKEVKTTIQGKVKTVSPLVVTVKDVDYTVNVSSDTAILNWFWLKTSLSSFKAGDTVRVYGVVNSIIPSTLLS